MVELGRGNEEVGNLTWDGFRKICQNNIFSTGDSHFSIGDESLGTGGEWVMSLAFLI